MIPYIVAYIGTSSTSVLELNNSCHWLSGFFAKLFLIFAEALLGAQILSHSTCSNSVSHSQSHSVELEAQALAHSTICSVASASLLVAVNIITYIIELMLRI